MPFSWFCIGFLAGISVMLLAIMYVLAIINAKNRNNAEN